MARLCVASCRTPAQDIDGKIKYSQTHENKGNPDGTACQKVPLTVGFSLQPAPACTD